MEKFLTKSERKLRKLWLILFLSFSGIGIGLLASGLSILIIYKRNELGLDDLKMVFFSFIYLIFCMLCVYGFYYCAYKKFGRIWLLWGLISISIIGIVSTIELIVGSATLFSFLLSISFCIGLFLFYFMLYRINKKVFLRILDSSTNYSRLVSEIKTACNLADLETIYYNEVKNNPLFEKWVIKEFRKRKKILQKEKKFQLDS